MNGGLIPIKKNKLEKDVYTNFALISQLGISMLVPIFMLMALGIYLEKKFSIPLTLPCIILGVMAGCRNTYHLAKKAIGKSEGEKSVKEEQEMVNDVLREWNDGRQFTEHKVTDNGRNEEDR